MSQALTLSNFLELNTDESLSVTGGGLFNSVLGAVVGIVLIANAPVIGAVAAVVAASTAIGVGAGLIAAGSGLIILGTSMN